MRQSAGALIAAFFLAIVFVPSALAGPEGEAATWQETLDQVSRAVVSIRVTATRDFDTENASVSQGTGFVVDRERGILLTNRHMVHAGPVISEGILLNFEEIDLYPIYRDPVHDFGFYRFDPEAVKYMDLGELELDAEGARVGTEIRVVGNDAGEKLSILDGTLARLDRNAPNYGGNNYNDFNTFYIQAASNTSGGSSGSPVVDQRGKVVALNAGGNTGAASSFYLPLDRVVRALDLIREGEPVTRGTLQTMFVYTAFDELNRLGLRPETEAEAREAVPEGTGMLVVRQVVPGGPADGKLEVGDVLTHIGGELVTEFVGLESVLDASVDRPVTMQVERGGEVKVLRLKGGDLHAITPATYLEVGRGILHNLSYQQARNHNRPVQGVYLTVPGYMWSTAQVPAGAIIQEIDGEPVPDLDTFQQVIEGKAQGQRIRIRFQMVNDDKHAYETSGVMERLWYPMRRCTREDERGRWPCVEAKAPPEPEPVKPASAILGDDGGKIAMRVAPALVLVDYDIPHPTAGVKDFNYVGVGTIVDAEQGLLIVDRDTVPVVLGDLMLTFAGTVRVPAKIRYLHPIHNFAVLQYDPSLLGDVPVSEITWSTRDVEVDDTVWQIARNSDHELVEKKSKVEYYEHRWVGMSNTPRFRDSNLRVIDLAEADSSLGGVVVDKKGAVLGLWASFLDQASGDRSFHGLPRQYVQPVVEAIRKGKEPKVRALGADLTTRPLAEARDRGLSDEWIRKLMTLDPEHKVALEVHRVHGSTPAAGVLRDTDLLLAIDGKPVSSMLEILEAERKKKLSVTVLRDGKTLDLTFDTVEVDGTGTDRVVSWAGLVVHAPHREVAAQRGIEPTGVYIAWLWYGSPGARYGIRPTRRIVKVDDVPTPDLDAFLSAVEGKGDRESVRITMESLDGSIRVNTLKLDLRFWPTQVFEMSGGEWTRTTLSDAAVDTAE